MDEKGKYIYCIINANRDYNPPATLPFAESKRASKSFGYIGINNREVKLVPCKDIAAVVSNTPIINFDRLNKEELTKYVVIHQKVNEVVTGEYDVVPMTFGIIAPNLNEVLRILEKAYLQFKTALRNTAGKTEFAVQVWWDPKKLLEELANTNPEIQRLKQEMSLRGSILGMPIKLKVGKLIAQKIETQRQAYIKDIQSSLRNLAYDFTLNKLIDENMIANLSFLIEKAKEPELDRMMQELGKKYEGKLRFKYIGPMPPYSFVNINLSIDNFRLVDETRRLLGLDKEATFNEVQKAYHTLAHQYHPDKGGDKKKMKEINQAYSILKSYCQSSAELTGREFDPNQKYSFRENDIKKSILIH
ncbi:GvpL/GvpF family gas vesicle protein [Patescibacteria group bacterium]|nr:GvpL/GvpF family gas vesicle protein [Patescibacteria group bacterium]